MNDDIKIFGDSVLSPPKEALDTLENDSNSVGGPWTLPSEYEGSVGTMMFDTPSSKDGTVTVLMPKDKIDALPSQALVRIESLSDKRTYIGAVVEGPFAEPDGLRADSTPMVVTTVKGGILMPEYHGRSQIELIGERLEDGVIVPPRRRPKPNSPVFALDPEETTRVLKIEGDLDLGLVDGFDDLSVSIPSNSKSVFPRHIGVLGTTGGGKSTTVSGLLKKAQEAGMAVVVIDTEGEYCAIDEPAEKAEIVMALKRRGLEPEGVKNTGVYHLVGRETSNPDHPNISKFSLRFSELSPHAVKEILDLNEAQEQRFIKAYDLTKRAMEQFKIWPVTPEEKTQVLELDELETGYPKMTLAHLLDVVKQIAAHVGKEDDPPLQIPEFRNKRDELKRIISGAKVPSHKYSWWVLIGKLYKISRLNIFDSNQAAPLDYKNMLKKGCVSILDLSDTDSPQINNLVIAELLRGVQNQQEENYINAVKNGRSPIPATIFIEEAHEFLSAKRIKKMEVLFQQVARIARRGRKRWLGLIFITQLPQHLPDEVLGLINSWILHKISDTGVVNRLKKSIGGLNDAQWRFLPSLAPGQAVVSFTSFSRPLQITVDPAQCKLLMVD
jgi:hypothetical protein